MAEKNFHPSSGEVQESAGSDTPVSRTRAARPEDVGLLPDIHQSSRELFRGSAHEHVLERSTLGVDYLRKAQAEGLLWVATDNTRSVVGFAVAEIIADSVHVEQLSVVPDAGGKGLGRELMGDAMLWAKAHGYPSVTLVTYSNIAWNRPFYEKIGFAVRPPESLVSAQQHVMNEDAAAGFDPSQRVFMEAYV